MTYITDAMERILLDSLADRAATEQSRRKTVTQSRGASAEPSATPAGPPAFRHTVELGGPVSFCRPPVATPGRWGSGHDVQTQAVVPVGIARSEEHTSELQSLAYLVCRLLLEKKKKE